MENTEKDYKEEFKTYIQKKQLSKRKNHIYDMKVLNKIISISDLEKDIDENNKEDKEDR